MKSKQVRGWKVLPGLIVLYLMVPGLFGQCYELVWSDEFNGTTLDTSVWQYEVHGDGGGNNELQYYTDRTENLKVADGLLTITAIEESYMGRDYTSARINTWEGFNFKYGKIETRMKLPYGQGIWPAFWLLGTNLSEAGWPDCGEIDVMEMIGGGAGRDNTIYSTLHWGPVVNNGHPSYGLPYTLSSGIFADDFHTLVTEWTGSTINTYCDNNLFYTIDIAADGLEAFHNQFFFIINLAVGGNWPGNPDATTIFPQQFQIDYVRLYQTSEMISIDGPEEVFRNDSMLVYTLPDVDGWNYDWTTGDGYEIVGRSDSNSVFVNWGCTAGKIICLVDGNCTDETFELEVGLRDPEIAGPTFFLGNDTGLLFIAPLLHSSDYTWSVPADATIKTGQGTSAIVVDWGTTPDLVQLAIENDCGSQSLSSMLYLYGQYPYPDPEVKHSIPGMINATEFDYGGEGVAYHDLEGLNQGAGPRQDEGVDTEFGDNSQPNVGWINSGEWLEFSIAVAESREYSVSLRLASDITGSRGPIQLLANNEVRATVDIPYTTGWTNFESVSENIYLTRDDTLLRVEMGSGGFNLSDIDFGDPLVLRTSFINPVVVYPNPFSDQVTIVSAESVTQVGIIDITGRVVKHVQGNMMKQIHIDTADLPAGLYILRTQLTTHEPGILRIVK
jgi:beta-glucanase (GH16 family)